MVMMFVAPMLLTGIFYVAFGGADTQTTIAPVRAVLVNQDAPGDQFGGFSVGASLAGLLTSEDLRAVLTLTELADESSARAEVDARRTDLAILLPAGLTQALASPGVTSTVTLYHDPALTVGPTLVRGIINDYVDGFAGVKIAAQVLRRQFEEAGLPVDEQLELASIQSYASWASAAGQSVQSGALSQLRIVAPNVPGDAPAPSATMLATTMIGMAIFFVFFTGAATAETLIKEDEEHTLARMYTTPTRHSAILGGKFLSVLVTLVAQTVVLLVAGSLVFGIHWGQSVSVILMTVGLVVASGGFGIFVMSLIKTTRQTGPLMGIVLTLSGMLGGLMTIGIQNLPHSYEIINLFTPHGWALRGWKLALAGSGAGAVWPTALACVGWGAITFAVGLVRFRKRFA
jgi:ABC-2 type transport system permease protein